MHKLLRIEGRSRNDNARMQSKSACQLASSEAMNVLKSTLQRKSGNISRESLVRGWENDCRGLQVLRSTSATKGTNETAEVSPCLAVSAITLFCTYPADRMLTCDTECAIEMYAFTSHRRGLFAGMRKYATQHISFKQLKDTVNSAALMP